jgi:hypothetical protein
VEDRGVAVHVDLALGSDGRATLLYTRARATFVSGKGPRFVLIAGDTYPVDPEVAELDVLAEGHAVDIGALTGHCDELGATVAAFAGISVEPIGLAASDGFTVAVVSRRDIASHKVLMSLVNACTMLASSGPERYEVLGRLDGTSIPPSGPWNRRALPAVAMPGPGEVVVGAKRLGGEVVMCAWAKARLDAQPFLAHLGAGLDPDTGDLIPASVRSQLPGTGASSLAYDGDTVELRWARDDVSAAQLSAGARALTMLTAAPAAGAFR